MATTASTAGREEEFIETFGTFLREYYHEAVLKLAEQYPSDQQAIHVDWMDLYRFDPDLADDLLTQPEEMIEYADEALRRYDLPIDVALSDAHVRVTDIQSDTDLTDLGKNKYTSRLTAVTGQVTRVSKIRPEIEEAAFECQRCGTITYIPQKNGFQEPHECQGCERQGPFTINHDQSTYRDHQLVRVQKPPEGGDGAGTQIDVTLHDDQVTSIQDRGTGDYFEAGDKLRLGVIQSIVQSDGGDSPVFDTSYEAHYYTVEDTTFEDLDIDEHEATIRAIANGERGDPYELITDSILPDHYGDEEIKLAIALQLFGGWAKEKPAGGRERGDIHILLLGDPGSGKSTFLRAASTIVPRSVYASGKGASAAGMTASAVQDDFGGGSEWTLKAGAMVQADQGLACVDEIDKMDEDAVSSMHEALESQRVKVNKAGINAELNARTSLLAAGNPKYGRFDGHEPIGEQIDLDPPLMSRFDLMFMVSDDPGEGDGDVVEHMLRSSTAAGEYTLSGEVPEELSDTVEPAIDLDVLRAYIAYAQQEVHPQIRDEAVIEAIKDFFVGFRQAAADEEDVPVPVTFRAVEGIRRLAEASARIRLSDEIAMEDVERATDLVQTSMRQVGYDPESGEFDADIVETGQSASQRDRMKRLRSLIADLADEHSRGAPVDEVVEQAVEEFDTDAGKVRHEIDSLKQKGEIYESGKNSECLRTT